MDTAIQSDLLAQWHVWAMPVAWTMLSLLLLFAIVQFALSSPDGVLTRLIPRSTLRGSLVAGLILVGVIPVIALGIVLAERSAHTRIDRIAARMEDTSVGVTASIDQFLDKHVSGITSAASAISSANRFDQLSMTRWTMLYHRIYTDFLTTLHADPNGDIVTATSNMTGFLQAVDSLNGHNVSDREYFRVPMDNGLTFVSDVFQGRDLGDDVIVAISAPLRNDIGETVGIIEGSLDLRAFELIDQNRARLEGAELILVDQQSRVIYASESAGLSALQNVSTDPLLVAAQHGRRNGSFSFDVGTEGHTAHYIGVTATTRNGWQAYLRMPIDSIYAQMAADYRSAFTFGLVVCALALMLALAIVRRVTQSLNDMNTAIETLDFQQHEDSIRTPRNTFSEFRPLFQRFRKRSRSLRKAYDRLNVSMAAGQELRSKLNNAIATKEAELFERTEHLEEANRQLSEVSKIDALTGIANRREFDVFQERVWRLGERDTSPVALVLIDIDFFKIYNDKLGHQAGDECLSRVARTLAACAKRPLDLVARYGGEEFVAVLGDTSLQAALVVADRMRNAVLEQAIPHPGSTHNVLTVSVGVAAAEPAVKATPEEVLKAADEALYYAKAAGRNAVVHEQGGEFETFDVEALDLSETNVLSILSARRF